MSTQIQLTEPEQLKYLTVGEMREEIAELVGGDVDRYDRNTHSGFLEYELRLIAEEIQPEDDDTDLEKTGRVGTYRTVCRWLDVGREKTGRGDYEILKRDQLKELHRTLFDEAGPGETSR